MISHDEACPVLVEHCPALLVPGAETEDEFCTDGSAPRDRAYDPELVAALGRLPQFDLTDIPDARATERALISAAPAVDVSDLDVEDVNIGAEDAPSAVSVRVYRPARPASLARRGVLVIHGGGFVTGSIDSVHGRCAELARELRTVIVSVDYRLAPEHPYPAPLDDCYTALHWIADSAPGLGIATSGVVVHGISSGACLAAALALLSRDQNGPAISFQHMSAPSLDDRLTTTSMREFVDTPLWSRRLAAFSWDCYLGPGIAGSATVPPYAAPGRERDLRDLPPAYISLNEFDPLRDEGFGYGQALLRAGVSVEMHLFSRTLHGSAHVLPAAVSRRQLADETAALQRSVS